jgi:hypothetical protein
MSRYRTALVALILAIFAQGVHGQAPPVPNPADVVIIKAIPPAAVAVPRDLAFATIQGTALDATNAPLPNRLVRLRDARTGRIVGTQFTDASGVFRFRTVEPGTYIVELMDDDRDDVLAASHLLEADAGTVVTAVVKLAAGGARRSLVGLILGPGLSNALAVASAAAAAGVLVTNVTGEDVSPR